MRAKIRVALIGFGGMGRQYAQMIFQGLVPDMVLAGVCCRSEAGQAVLRESFPGVAIYRDVDDTARHQAEFDAVIVVTPHVTHVPIAMQFAKLGKHILMDKPAGVCAGEVRALAEFCEEAGVSFGMIFNNRRLPAFRAAKEFLCSGGMGKLHRAVWVCNSWYRSPAYHRSAGWRSSWNGECGGLMINQNPHYLDMWQWFFGMPDRIWADMAFGRYNDFLVDDAVDIQLSYDSGFRGSFISATGEAPGVNRLEIWGSKGKLTIEEAARVTFDENQVSTEEFAEINREKFAGIPHRLREIPLEPPTNPYQEVMENFASHLIDGQPLFADGWDGLRTTQLVNAVYVSGWEECRVSVPVEEGRFAAGLAWRQKMEREGNTESKNRSINAGGSKKMDAKEIMQIFEDTAYIRTGGSKEELRCAEYLKARCGKLGLEAGIEPFDIDMATMQEAVFLADGVSIPCKGYLNAGSGEVEAPFYYLRSKDDYSLSQCRGKIVMVDGYLGYWVYQDLLENGAVGFITYDGNANYADMDIDERQLHGYISKGHKIPGVNINAKDAIALVNKGVTTAKICLKQEEYLGQSRNVVLDLPGQTEEYIVLTAHYDSTSLSQGAYDNMSGSVGLLAIAEYFAKNPHRYGLRFIWCGSEELGLLGSKAYVAAHEEELKNMVLNINLDMVGCIMGKFIACCTTEEQLVSYITYFGMELGFGISAKQDVYSSDSTPFADKGVPALSFARIAPKNTATIHNSYDTMAVMKGEQMVEDIEFLIAFTRRMANAARCPVGRQIPDNVKEKLDIYLGRKRAPK